MCGEILDAVLPGVQSCLSDRCCCAARSAEKSAVSLWSWCKPREGNNRVTQRNNRVGIPPDKGPMGPWPIGHIKGPWGRAHGARAHGPKGPGPMRPGTHGVHGPNERALGPNGPWAQWAQMGRAQWAGPGWHTLRARLLPNPFRTLVQYVQYA